jgi:hypothetical protein
MTFKLGFPSCFAGLAGRLRKVGIAAGLLFFGLGLGGAQSAPAPGRRGAAVKAVEASGPDRTPAMFHYQADCLAAAIDALSRRHGVTAYPGGVGYRARLERLRAEVPADRATTDRLLGAPWEELQNLKIEALLANPALQAIDRVLVVKRKPRPPARPSAGRPNWVARGAGLEIGLPSNHECNSSLERTGYDNEIATFAPREPAAPLRPLYRPAETGYVGEIDLHPDADRLLFTQSGARHWQVLEIRVDGSGRRQVTRLPDDVDCYDACYLPDDRIVFGSSAAFQAVPCWHGLKVVSNLYLANADGSGVRRLCYDQDHNLHPAVLPDGQLIYSRWDYTGLGHIFVRELMLMNPDGTGQRAVYGSNS